MSERKVTETIATIDEDGDPVIVTRVRNYKRVSKSDGAFDEVEDAPDLHVDGEQSFQLRTIPYSDIGRQRRGGSFV